MADHPRLLHEVTLPQGPQMVRFGRRIYGVPQEAGVAYAAGGNIAYVLHHGRVHVLTWSGEIEVPARLRGIIASQHFGGLRKTFRAPG